MPRLKRDISSRPRLETAQSFVDSRFAMLSQDGGREKAKRDCATRILESRREKASAGAVTFLPPRDISSIRQGRWQVLRKCGAQVANSNQQTPRELLAALSTEVWWEVFGWEVFVPSGPWGGFPHSRCLAG